MQTQISGVNIFYTFHISCFSFRTDDLRFSLMPFTFPEDHKKKKKTSDNKHTDDQCSVSIVVVTCRSEPDVSYQVSWTELQLQISSLAVIRHKNMWVRFRH